MKNSTDEDHLVTKMREVNIYSYPPTVTPHLRQLESEPTKIIECLQCTAKYTFPKDKDDYLMHLFSNHHLIIADVNDIALLDEYLISWKNYFRSDQDLKEYCTTMLLDQLPDGSPAKDEEYFLLSDIVPYDYDLRQQLRVLRLERALARHQIELTDRTFTKQCLYCRDVVKGLRADYLKHLYEKHFIQLGNPEKLVYIDELIVKLEDNIKNSVCLYCENNFKDRNTLKEHMRKKKHKQINPDNVAYDCFFLVNYRIDRPSSSSTKTTSKYEPKANYSMECNASSEDIYLDGLFNDNVDLSWSDWAEKQPSDVICLYCPFKNTTYESFKKHMLTEHEVDFENAIGNLNFYQRIKKINYVRRQVSLHCCVSCDAQSENNTALLEHMKTEKHFNLGTQNQWDKPQYYFPYLEDDNLLCMLDDLSEIGNENDGTCSTSTDSSNVLIIVEDSPEIRSNKYAEELSLETFQH